MRIAIIGWGSLIWDRRGLPKEGTWQKGGPELPIEFSRVSKDARLTLVIDETNGVVVPTRYVLSPRSLIQDAVADLREREGTARKYVGFVDIQHGTGSGQEFPQQPKVRDWCHREGFDGAVWTALPPNFKEQVGKDFSVDNSVSYLKGLPKDARENALHYIQSAPEEVKTPLRARLVDERMVEDSVPVLPGLRARDGPQPG